MHAQDPVLVTVRGASHLFRVRRLSGCIMQFLFGKVVDDAFTRVHYICVSLSSAVGFGTNM